jgi:hypothetical protein
MHRNNRLVASNGLLKILLLISIVLVPLKLQCFGQSGSISGRVTDELSAGLPNVAVRVYWKGLTSPTKTVYTDAQGYYTATGLGAGAYNALFTLSGYIGEYYSDKHSYSEAETITVPSGTSVADINAVLAAIPPDIYEPNNDIGSAYALAPGTHNNITYINTAGCEGCDSEWFKVHLEEGQDLKFETGNVIPIAPYPETGNADIDIFLYDSSGNVVAEATSSRAIETLYLSNATAGWYYISIAYALDSVFSLSVSVGDLDVGEIRGRVTNGLGEGVPNVRAAFYTWNNLDWSLFHANAVTDASGNYRFASAPGSFRIFFDAAAAGDPYVLSEWYDNQSVSTTSTIASISAGLAAIIDAQLEDGAAISGHVTDLSSNPLISAMARVTDPQGNFYSSYAYSDANGLYTIGHIPVGNGTTRVRFSKSGYALEWSNDKASYNFADTVAIQPRQTTTGVDAQMATQGRITGCITNSLGSGIIGATVTAYDTISNSWAVRSATTDSSGCYTLNQLPTMSARVYFDPGRASAYNAEFYSDKLNFSSADSVSVTAGSTTSNINAQLSSRSINIHEPDGGERWCAGSGHALEWTNTGSIANVRIEYSTDGGANYSTVAASAPNTGTYPWIVPAASSSNVYVRISDASNPADFDESNAAIRVSTGQCRTPGDFNGDGHSDATVWRPSSGTWFSSLNYEAGSYSATQWGLDSDLPVAGDYDGDGKLDIAVWRPSSGMWYYLPSNSPGDYLATQWGVETDIPIPGDYDGDGKTDLAVFRPSSGVWYILPSTAPGTYQARGWGLGSDIPVPADYDGDGKSDVAVWRPSSGVWYVLPSASPGSYTGTQWGVSGDIPLPGDYDGDFKSDIAVWRPSSGVWYFLMSASMSGVYSSTSWGMIGDKPATGDYDGDGIIDVTVWRPSNGVWYVLLSTHPGTYVSASWGRADDQPVTAISPIVRQFP